MSKIQHSEAQMIGALKQLEAGRKAEDVAREVGVEQDPEKLVALSQEIVRLLDEKEKRLKQRRSGPVKPYKPMDR